MVLESRKASFKKGIDSTESRRRRDDTRLTLRKNKREEGLAKRRAMGAATVGAIPSNSTEQLISAENDSTPVVGVSGKKVFTVADIPSLLPVLTNQASDNDSLLEAVKGFRRMLSVETNPPVKEVLDCGAMTYFIKLLERTDFEMIQFEAAWALTNIASTEHTATVADAGAIPSLVQLLRSPNADVREQSAWCLGNVAGDSTALRDFVLSAGAMEPLLLNVAHPASKSCLLNAVWTLSNFCRGQPQPDLSVVGQAIPHLAAILQGENRDAMMDACWALSYLSDGSDDRVQAVIDAGVVPRLVFLLSDDDTSIVTPALRTLGNMVSGTDVQTQAILNAGVLEHVGSLLAHTKKNVRRDTCWLLSNIAAGTHGQISTLLESRQEIMAIVNAMKAEVWYVRKEAAWVICNIATGGSDYHVRCLVDLFVIDALCDILDVADAKITLVALDAIKSILKVGDYISFIDEAGGIDQLESLLDHENDEVYQKAIEIIDEFFGVDDDVADELVPEQSENTYSFGVSNNMKSNAGEAPQGQPLGMFNFSG
uniref:Importin subunit alpha n=1 Tax=Ditylum brightwellii TaxID=49249 RepID=A0A7S4QYI7_9STRA